MENISIAKVTLHKLPDKSSLNVISVYPVCPVCPVCPICPVCPVCPLKNKTGVGRQKVGIF